MNSSKPKIFGIIAYFKKHKAYLWLLCVFFVFLSYSDGIRGEFVFDDIPLIVNDPFYKTEMNPLKCWERSFWKESRQQGLYRPMTNFSYWIDVRLFGLKSRFFRAENFLLHLFVCFLLYKYAIRLRLGKITALLAALLFALHPIHTESVIPASGRGELLCAIFLLSGLISHSRSGFFFSVAAGVSFLFACWSKEHGLVFLPLCVLQDIYLRRINLRDSKTFFSNKTIARYSFLILAIALFFISRYALLGTFIPAKNNFEAGIDNPIALSPLIIREVSAIRIHGMALLKFIWPAVLSHDYSFAQLFPSASSWDLKAFLTILLFAGIPAIFIFLFPHEKRKTLFFICAYLFSILIAGNFIVPAGTIFAERLQYFPSVWLCFFLITVFLRISRKIPFFTAAVFLFAIFAACGIRTYSRSLDWQNEMTLAVAGVKSAPNSAKSWNNLAIQLETVGNYSEALAACDRAIKIYPEYSTAWANRGVYNTKLGNFADAEKDMRHSLDIYHKDIQAAHNLGILLASLGRLEEAKIIWEKSLKNHPDQPALKQELEKLNELIRKEEK